MSGAATAVAYHPTCCYEGAVWIKKHPLLVTAVCLAILAGIAGVLYTTDFTWKAKIIVGLVAGATVVAIPLLFLSCHQNRQKEPYEVIADLDRSIIENLCSELGIRKYDEFDLEEAQTDESDVIAKVNKIALVKNNEGATLLVLKVQKRDGSELPRLIAINVTVDNNVERAKFDIETPSDLFPEETNLYRTFSLSDNTEGVEDINLNNFLEFGKVVKYSLKTLIAGRHAIYQLV